METEAKCLKCGTTLEESSHDTAFYEDMFVRHIIGNCPKCGTIYQWKEYYDYTGVEGVTEC